jgi:hypothetical protein
VIGRRQWFAVDVDQRLASVRLRIDEPAQRRAVGTRQPDGLLDCGGPVAELVLVDARLEVGYRQHLLVIGPAVDVGAAVAEAVDLVGATGDGGDGRAVGAALDVDSADGGDRCGVDGVQLHRFCGGHRQFVGAQPSSVQQVNDREAVPAVSSPRGMFGTSLRTEMVLCGV